MQHQLPEDTNIRVSTLVHLGKAKQSAEYNLVWSTRDQNYANVDSLVPCWAKKASKHFPQLLLILTRKHMAWVSGEHPIWTGTTVNDVWDKKVGRRGLSGLICWGLNQGSVGIKERLGASPAEVFSFNAAALHFPWVQWLWESAYFIQGTKRFVRSQGTTHGQT